MYTKLRKRTIIQKIQVGRAPTNVNNNKKNVVDNSTGIEEVLPVMVTPKTGPHKNTRSKANVRRRLNDHNKHEQFVQSTQKVVNNNQKVIALQEDEELLDYECDEQPDHPREFILHDGVDIDVDGDDFETDDEVQFNVVLNDGIELGATVATAAAEKGGGKSPKVDVLLHQLLKEKLKEVDPDKINELLQSSDKSKSNNKGGNNGNDRNVNITNSDKSPAVRVNGVNHVVKSPSDTTLYRPAFNVRLAESNGNPIVQQDKQVSEQTNLARLQQHQNTIMNQISCFVEAIWFEHEDGASRSDPQPDTSTAVGQASREYLEAKDRADQTVIQAEQFKAAIEPPGNNIGIDSVNVPLLPVQEMEKCTDDDFFHLTCHIDDNLRGKIKRGEFVELKKLLPREGNKQEN